MSASSPLSTPALRVDHLAHDILRESFADQRIDSPSSVRDDVRLDDSRPCESDEGGDTIETAHRATEAVEVAHGAYELAHAAHTSGTVMAGTGTAEAATLLAPVALTGGSMLLGAAGEFHRGETFVAQVQYDRMKGILAALEGRAGRPEVVAEAARSSGFREGLRDVEHASPRTIARAQAAVRESRDDGYTLVGLGQDRGRAFERRYHSDLAFHHAVDYARRCRDENRPEWVPMRERAEAIHDALHQATLSAPIRG